MVKFKSPVVVSLLAVAVVVFGASALGWCYHNKTKPTKVFERMLVTSLTTPSVTKTIAQEENGQKLSQTVQLTVNPTAQVHAKNILDQGQAVITTESVANQTNDFIRYQAIQTDQKNSAGSSFDFSAVLGVWGKSSDNPETGEQAQLFDQTVLGVIPFGKLSPDERSRLLKQIATDNVYEVNYDTVKRSTLGGRPVYSYEVTVQPVRYVKMLKTFASSLGLKQLEDVDAEQYGNAEALKFSFDIDVWSAQLTKVTYLESGRTESYTAYGAAVIVDEPRDSVTLEELQSRLQKVQ